MSIPPSESPSWKKPFSSFSSSKRYVFLHKLYMLISRFPESTTTFPKNVDMNVTIFVNIQNAYTTQNKGISLNSSNMTGSKIPARNTIEKTTQFETSGFFLIVILFSIRIMFNLLFLMHSSPVPVCHSAVNRIFEFCSKLTFVHSFWT